MKQTEKKRTKRPYLDKEERRKNLIAQAANLVESKGWAVLNMSALAEHAKVSRQLVYQHFPNLEGLLVETASHIFAEVALQSQEAIFGHQDNLNAAIRSAALVSLDLPKGRGNALWQLIAGMNYGSEELEKIRLHIRELIISWWLPVFTKYTKADDASNRTIIWMLIMSFWGLRQMIWDGLVSREQGLVELDRMIAAVLKSA